MNVFLDTSSLFKLYHQEDGTDELLQLLSDKSIKTIYLSELAKVEFTSSIWKKVRTKEIEQERARVTLSLFQNDLYKYKFVTTDSLLLEISESLVTKYNFEGLRTLDSIQLASCLFLKITVSIFITSDKLLKKLMEKEGLKTSL